MKTDIPARNRRLPDTNQCNLCDRPTPGTRVATFERPRHYTAKRGSDAAAFRIQVRMVREVFYYAPECQQDYGVAAKQKVSLSP